MRKQILKNQSGMTIVGVLVGAAAMLVIGLSISQLIQSQSEMVFFLEDRLSAVNLKAELQISLDNQEACVKSLNAGNNGNAPKQIVNQSRNPASADPVGLGQLVNSKGEPIYRVGNDSLAKYDHLNIKQIRALPTETINATTPGVIEFVVTTERTRGKMKTLAPIKIQKLISVSNGKVTDCRRPADEGADDSIPGLVKGNIANISGGCGGGDPKDFEALSNLDKAGVPSLEFHWLKHCREQTYPQPKKSFDMYLITRDGKKTSSASILNRAYSSGNMGDLPSKAVVEEVTDIRAPAGVGRRAMGPYANQWQCEHDGITPAGTIKTWSTGSGSGGSGGNGSGRDVHSAVCVNGSWAGQ